MANTAPAPGGKAPLVALIAAAAALSMPLVAKWEGKRNEPYRDVVNVLTVCYGSTKGVQARRYSDAECRALLAEDWWTHAEGVARCTPEITENARVLAAASSLAFNIGVSAYCKSTAARKFRAGDFRGGCEALGLFNRAGGKVLRGLERRRGEEVQMCLEGLK